MDFWHCLFNKPEYVTFPESTACDGPVRRARLFVENGLLPLARRYPGCVGIFQDGLIDELIAHKKEVDDPVDHFRRCFKIVQDIDHIGQLLYVNMKAYLPGDLLFKTGRMSMANFLEPRCPFLDQEFLEFAASLPTDLKLSELNKKYILKKALEGLVPSEILHRKKHGFGVPVGRWFRTSLKDYVRGVLISPQALRRSYFREEVVRQLIDEHQSGRRDWGHQLWTLLTFEICHQVFIDQEINP